MQCTHTLGGIGGGQTSGCSDLSRRRTGGSLRGGDQLISGRKALAAEKTSDTDTHTHTSVPIEVGASVKHDGLQMAEYRGQDRHACRLRAVESLFIG
jgi:hypothetical protein